MGSRRRRSRAVAGRRSERGVPQPRRAVGSGVGSAGGKVVWLRISALSLSSGRWRERQLSREPRQTVSIFLRDLGLERVVQGVAAQSRVPALTIAAKVGATTGFLAGRVDLDVPITDADEPDELPLR